ncbi:MAG TPA: hypothetical protein VGF14_04530 [Alphaproteobacteria bacterium]
MTTKLTYLATTALLLLGTGAAHADPFCREFTSNVNVGGRLQQGVGTACLNPDGSWQIVSGDNAGSTFYDNGPDGFGSNNVTYVQPATPVYYQQPQVNYVMRDRVYVPSSTLIITNNRYRPVYRPYRVSSYNYRPWGGWDHGRRRGPDRHDRDDHRGGGGRGHH